LAEIGAHRVLTARQRCWRYDWVVDIDIKGFFDSIDWALLLKAIRKHTDCPWVLLYIERWLKAPAMLEDGTLVRRERGTPQGGVISPLLANLFLHYVFDIWLKRVVPGVPFERYADDIICHCRSEREALALRQVLDRRFAECGLVLHPEKTKVVYCKDTNRNGNHSIHQFDFLGYSFWPRLAKWRGVVRGCRTFRQQPQGPESDPSGNPGMDPPDPERQGAGRPGADVQSVHPRLDQLLQSLL
jgi:group II intron reverse transcriptase/maturase